MYQTSKDIFTHLNIIFKFIKADDNVPLYGYKNKTFLEFITTHNYSHLIDKGFLQIKKIIYLFLQMKNIHLFLKMLLKFRI